MAIDQERINILMSVNFDDSNTLKEIAALRASTAGLKEDQKKLNTTTEEGAVSYERLGIQIRQNNAQVAALTKTVINGNKAFEADAGSIDRLTATLSIATAAYNKLGDKDKETAVGMRLKQIVTDTTAALKAQRAEIGDFRMSVGGYTLAINEAGVVTKEVFKEGVDQTEKSLGDLRETLRSLENISFAGKTEEEVVLIKQAIADTKAGIDDLREEFKALDTGEVFSNIVEGINVVVASATVLSNALAAAGVESESIDKIQSATMQLIATMQALSVITEYLEKQKIKRLATNVKDIASTVAQTLANRAAAAQLKLNAAAENGSTAAKLKGIVVTKALAFAQWLWNKAVIANPIGALVVAVAALIAGLVALISWLNKESDASKEAAKAEAAYDSQIKASAEIRNRIAREGQKQLEDRLLAGRKEIAELKANSASEAEILKARAKIDREVFDMKIENSKRALGADEAERMAIEDAIAAKEREIAGLERGKKKYNELTKEIADLKGEYQSLSVSIQAALYQIANGYQDQADAEKKLTADLNAEYKKRVDEQIKAFDKAIDEQRKNADLRLKAEAEYQSKDIKTRQDYARKTFKIGQDAELQKLDNLRKQSRITEAEHKASLERMRLELQSFANGQATELNAYWTQQRNAILGLLNKTVDEQIASVKKKYADAAKDLAAIEAPKRLEGESDTDYAARLKEYEAFALERTNLAIRLQKQQDAEIADIQQTGLAQQARKIEEATSKQYGSELLQYQNNEEKRLDILQKSLDAQKAAKIAAGLDVSAEEAALENVNLQRIGVTLNKELLLADNNAKARYNAKVKALEAEREAAGDNALLQLQIDQDLADAERELMDERIAATQQWIGAASSMFSALNDLFNAQSEARLQEITEEYNAEQAELDKKYANGLISEAEYNKKSTELEKKKEKEEAKLEREKAIRERIMALFNIAMNTAMGIMNAVSTFWLTGGMPWAAIIGALGAVQIAGVLAAPLPKAAQGGIIGGRKHSGGGTVIEAERGEAIMTAKSVSMFGPILSAINELGGGVPFAAPYSDGGYVSRHIQERGLTVDDMVDALSSLQIVTYVEDINREQGLYNEIKTAGTIPG